MVYVNKESYIRSTYGLLSFTYLFTNYVSCKTCKSFYVNLKIYPT